MKMVKMLKANRTNFTLFKSYFDFVTSSKTKFCNPELPLKYKKIT